MNIEHFCNLVQRILAYRFLSYNIEVEAPIDLLGQQEEYVIARVGSEKRNIYLPSYDTYNNKEDLEQFVMDQWLASPDTPLKILSVHGGCVPMYDTLLNLLYVPVSFVSDNWIVKTETTTLADETVINCWTSGVNQHDKAIHYNVMFIIDQSTKKVKVDTPSEADWQKLIQHKWDFLPHPTNRAAWPILGRTTQPDYDGQHLFMLNTYSIDCFLKIEECWVRVPWAFVKENKDQLPKAIQEEIKFVLNMNANSV
ncbi:hypothetical protein D3C78_19700 [compost metagenome]